MVNHYAKGTNIPKRAPNVLEIKKKSLNLHSDLQEYTLTYIIIIFLSYDKSRHCQ